MLVGRRIVFKKNLYAGDSETPYFEWARKGDFGRIVGQDGVGYRVKRDGHPGEFRAQALEEFDFV